MTIDNTLCLKKVPTFKLSLTLSNPNRFSRQLEGQLSPFAPVATPLQATTPLLRAIWHPYAGTWHSLLVYKIWSL